MKQETIKIVHELRLPDVLALVHTPKLAELIRTIWEMPSQNRVWLVQVALAANQVSLWLSARNHEWKEDTEQLEEFLDLLTDRMPQASKLTELKLRLITTLFNIIIDQEDPKDLVSRVVFGEDEDDGYDDEYDY